MRSYNFSEEEKHKTLKKVTFSSFLGNFIEWFDYASYSYLATVIANVFFPSDDPFVSTMNTFAVFALSFLVRPIGALFWGNMGDKKGRKWALAISILCMSGATFLIGCLPGYAMVGSWRRCCSWFFVWSRASLLLVSTLVLQRSSPSTRRRTSAVFTALWFRRPPLPACSWARCSLLSCSTRGARDSQFVTEWGWRIPFWLAGPLGLITHYIREHLEDSPVYEKMQDDLKAKGQTGEQTPVRTLLSKHLKRTIISFGACMLNAVGFYAVLTYLPNYLETVLMYDPGQATIITNIVLVVYIGFIFFSGHISDTFGRKKMLITACVGFIVCTVPAFMLLSSMNFVIILVVELFMALLLTINDGTLSSYLNETFPTEVRFSGFAFSFNLANAIFGGSASYISFFLISLTGDNLAPAYYMVVISLIALVAMIMSHEHSDKELDDVE